MGEHGRRGPHGCKACMWASSVGVPASWLPPALLGWLGLAVEEVRPWHSRPRQLGSSQSVQQARCGAVPGAGWGPGHPGRAHQRAHARSQHPTCPAVCRVIVSLKSNGFVSGVRLCFDPFLINAGELLPQLLLPCSARRQPQALDFVAGCSATPLPGPAAPIHTLVRGCTTKVFTPQQTRPCSPAHARTPVCPAHGPCSQAAQAGQGLPLPGAARLAPRPGKPCP